MPPTRQTRVFARGYVRVDDRLDVVRVRAMATSYRIRSGRATQSVIIAPK